MQAKLRAHGFADPKAALAWFDEQLASGLLRSETGTQYGRALAFTRLGRYNDARKVLEGLLREVPDNVAFQAALARNELASGDSQRAMDIYSRSLRLYPDDRVLVRGQVEALMAAGRADEALRLLDQYSRHNPMTAALYRLQALAFENLGRRGESLLALSEYAYLSGQLDVAIHHLEQAQALNNLDYYVGSRVHARLRDLDNERSLRAQR